MADTASGGGNVFTRHIGPLPMWAWTAIVGAVIVGYAWWKNRQAGASTSSTSSTANASQVPQFVNQTYTTVTPPSAPNVTVNDDDDTDKHPKRPKRRPAPRPANLGLSPANADAIDDAAKKTSGTVHKKKPTRKSGPVRRG